jgi:hypothetical protein
MEKWRAVNSRADGRTIARTKADLMAQAGVDLPRGDSEKLGAVWRIAGRLVARRDYPFISSRSTFRPKGAGGKLFCPGFPAARRAENPGRRTEQVAGLAYFRMILFARSGEPRCCTRSRAELRSHTARVRTLRAACSTPCRSKSGAPVSAHGSKCLSNPSPVPNPTRTRHSNNNGAVSKDYIGTKAGD